MSDVKRGKTRQVAQGLFLLEKGIGRDGRRRIGGQKEGGGSKGGTDESLQKVYFRDIASGGSVTIN